MSNKNSYVPLSDISFEDIMSEVDAQSTAGPRSSLKVTAGNKNERQSSTTSDFHIIKNFGKLSDRKNSATFAVVDWNGYERYDLRAWNEDYTVPFKGITFSEDELKRLYDDLKSYVPEIYKAPIYTVDMGKTKAKVLFVVSELYSATVKGVVWNKQVSIVDWGYGQKYDFRKWTEDYQKCSKGICLNQNEIDSLLEILESLV